MSRKFDMRICKCGRIHMVPIEKVDNALKADKELLLICAGCGKGTIIGADIEPNWFDDDSNDLVYNMYSRDFSPHLSIDISKINFEDCLLGKPFSEIFYSHGIQVPMMTGMYAGHYDNGKFSDEWYPDFWKIEREDVTVKEIMEFIDEWRQERITVNMNRLLHENDDAILEELSHYYIPAFDWKGTKFEKKG